MNKPIRPSGAGIRQHAAARVGTGLTALEGAIAAKTVTYDFARQMTGAKEIKRSEFGDAIIAHM